MKFLSGLFNRETAADRASWLDGAMRTAAGAAQTQYLSNLRQAQRSFETAETPAWTESWPTHAGELNQDLSRQRPTLVSRSRGLARNNEWAARYLLQLDDNVLGEVGIRLQMRMKLPDGSKDKRTNDLLEEAFATWGERGNCEASGKLSWREVESLALATLAKDGELLYRLLPGAGPFGFQIQILNPDLIDISLRRDWNGNRVRMGVEINDAGKPIAYWMRMTKAGDGPSDAITVGRHVRVPAEQLRHYFIVEEVDQLRGIPWLSVGARRLWLLHDFEESAAVASSNAAKRQGFFVSPNGDAPPGFADTVVSSVLDAAKAAGKVLSADEIQAITAAAEKYATTVPGQYDTLPQGYDFRPFESKWPTINADSYVKQQVRGWSAARGVSYVTLGNDLEAVNFSSARVGILDEREHYKAIQTKLISWLHADVCNAWLPYGVLATRGLKATQIPAYRRAVTWQRRRWAGIDPSKEANANDTNLKNQLTSRRRLILDRGEDPDEIAAEVAEEEAIYGPINAVNLGTPPKAEDDEETQEDKDAEGKAKKSIQRERHTNA